MRLRDQPWLAAPQTAAVFDALEAEGGRDCARFVGGAPRNAVMGLAVGDLDVATTLTPDRTIAALERAGLRAIPTGVEHGTVTALVAGHAFEITTLRRDVATDGRRAVVAFTTDWGEDAARRDFRLNALYCDRAGEVFDPTGGGIEDARAGRIVFVGEAETRIREDYLRILRFFRFFAWYGRTDPDAAGLDACARLKDGMARLSAERVGRELLKLLAAPDPREAVRLMAGAGVLARVLPYALEPARFEALVPLDPDPLLRLSALLPDDEAVVRGAATSLRLSNGERDRLLAALPDDIEVGPGAGERAARAAIYRLGASAFRDRLLRRAAETGEDFRPLLTLAETWTPPRFPLGGADVAALGLSPGPRTGALLRAVEDGWIADDFPETGLHQALADRAREGVDAGPAHAKAPASGTRRGRRP
jgi:poly(A) polymerase